MKDDIKQKFLDILFEKEEEDASSNDEKAPVEEIKEESTLKARDVLYRKPKSSAFIDYNNQVNIEKKSLNVDEVDYEFSVPISPIFGVIKENKKETVNVAPEITDALVNKPENSHLEIITSPIYGYGREDNITENNTESEGEDAYYTPEDEEDIHCIFDDEATESDNENDYEDDLNLFNSFGDYR